MSRLSRRQFLSTLTGVTGLTIATTCLPATAFAESDITDTLPLPPSIMLHSRHRWILPVLVEWLVAEGWQGITYQMLEKALLGDITLPEKSVILSIDDLSLSAGNPAYESFAAMHATVKEADFKAVFGVITRDEEPQDEERWAEVKSWSDAGMEMATHTMSHINLNNPELIDADYEREIVTSAQTITDRTGQEIRTLVTPFGSAYNRDLAMINPQVKVACSTAGIRFIVGIVDGRADLPTNPPSEQLFYVGRSGPGSNDSLPGLITTLENWHSYDHTKRPVS